MTCSDAEDPLVGCVGDVEGRTLKRAGLLSAEGILLLEIAQLTYLDSSVQTCTVLGLIIP